MNVEYTIPVPDEFSFVRNASFRPPNAGWAGLTSGKFGELVYPVT